MGSITSRLAIAAQRERELETEVGRIQAARVGWLASENQKIWDPDCPTQGPHGKASLERMLVDFPDLSNDKTWDDCQAQMDKLRVRREGMSEPGKILGSSRLVDLFPGLEWARWEYMIPDKVWTYWPAYDRLLVYQVPQVFAERTVGSAGLIVASEVTQDREKNTSCEAIILSAGLDGLDHLRSNGIDVGHRVSIVQNYMYRIRMGYTGKEEHMAGIIRSGDVCASFGLSSKLQDGDLSIISDEGALDHYFVDSRGRRLETPNTAKPRIEG